jgi:hypothetical protein
MGHPLTYLELSDHARDLTTRLAASQAREQAYRDEVVKMAGELAAKDAEICDVCGNSRRHAGGGCIHCITKWCKDKVNEAQVDAARYLWITRDGRTRGLKIPATESKASIDAAIDKAMQ